MFCKTCVTKSSALVDKVYKEREGLITKRVNILKLNPHKSIFSEENNTDTKAVCFLELKRISFESSSLEDKFIVRHFLTFHIQSAIPKLTLYFI